LIFKLVKLVCIYFILTSLSYAKNTIEIVDFVSEVLQKSDQALQIQDKNLFSELDLNTTKFDYEYQWVPSLLLGTSNNIKSQGLGFEVRKKTEFGTKFTVGSSYSRVSTDFDTLETPKAYINIEQGLFRQWGTDMGRMPLTQAELNTKRVFLLTVMERQSLLRRSIGAYFSALVTKKQLILREKTVDRAQENLAVSESRYGLDLVPKTDVYRSNLSLLNALDTQKQEQRLYNKNIRSLAESIKETDINAFDINDTVYIFKAQIPKNYLEIALKHRSDWKIYNLDEKLSKIELKRAENNLLPDIKLKISSEHYFEKFEISNNVQNSDLDWKIGLSYSSALTQTKEKNALIRQKIRYEQQKRDKQALKRKIKLDLQDSVDDIHLTQARLSIAKQRLLQSEKAVELAKLRYQRGLSSNLDLIDAENELQSAQIETLRQQINLNMVYVYFAEKLGILDVKWLEEKTNGL